MNMKKKWSASYFTTIALCIALLAGCSTNKGSNSSNTNTQPSSNVEGKTDGKMNISGLPITTEPQSFKIAVSKNSLTKNSFSEKQCVTDTEAKTNVKINWMEIPGSGWKEKTNIMFASGDLPDAFIGAVDVVKNLMSLAPIEGYINKYSPAIQKMFKERTDVKEAVTAPDGKIYSLPIGDETYNTLVQENLWINKAWLGKVGLPMPTTTDEFYKVLKAFKEKDPNGNGKADEIPFSSSQLGQNTINNMFGSFGTVDDDTHVRIENGKVVFAPSEKGYLNGLRWLNKLYAEGLMDQEAFIQNAEQYQSKGKSADIMGSFISFSPDTMVSAKQLANYVSVLPLKGPEGKQLWNRNKGFNFSGFTITKACKTPQVLVRWYDYLNSDMQIALEWNRGPKGVAWNLTSDGKWEIATANQPKEVSYGEWRHTISTGNSSPVFMKSEWAGPDGQNFTTERDKIKVDTVKAYLPFTVKETVTVGLDDPARVDQRNLLGVDIDNYIKKFKANSVMKGIDDAAWQEHLTTCKTLKVDEYTKLWQEFYNSKK